MIYRASVFCDMTQVQLKLSIHQIFFVLRILKI